MTDRATATAGRVADAIAVALIVGVSFAAGIYAVSSFRFEGGVQRFDQFEFGPAVLLACGHGYRSPNLDRLPGLVEFLRLETDSFDCANLPAEVPALQRLGDLQRTSRYLEISVAGLWRIIGISWSGLVLYGGLLYGAVCGLVYAIMRLALSRGWAVLATLPIVVSTINLTMIPHYRDYAKAPFMLAMILVMGWLVAAHSRPARTIGLAALGGVVAGIGLGFRNDVLIVIPPFLLVVLLLTPWDLPRLWQTRAAALAACSIAFMVAAWPVLRDYSEGSNTGHVILLGLMDPFDRPLGLQRSIYSFGGQYDDSLAYSIIDSYAHRIEHRAGDVRLGTREYDAAAAGYLAKIAWRFPADLAVRSIAAIREVPRFFFREYQYPPPWVHARLLHELSRLRAMMETRLAMVLPLLLLAAVLVVSVRSVRTALFVVLIVTTFAGGSAIQFNERHFFHLEFIGWWAVATLLQSALQVVRRQQVVEWRSAVRAGALVVAGGVTTVMVLVLLRTYQNARVQGLFSEYLSARTTTSRVVSMPAAGGRILLYPEPRRPDAGGQALETTYISATFSPRGCQVPVIPLTLRYQGAPMNDFSRSTQVRIGNREGENSRLLFPVYHRGVSIQFLGIEIEESARVCVSEIAEFDDTSAFPLLLDVVLEPGWSARRLHQTLTSWW